MPCDAALVAGECVVNESSLTGQPLPLALPPHPRRQAPLPFRAVFAGALLPLCSQVTILTSPLPAPQTPGEALLLFTSSWLGAGVSPFGGLL